MFSSFCAGSACNGCCLNTAHKGLRTSAAYEPAHVLVRTACEACQKSIEASKGKLVVKEAARAVSERDDRLLAEKLEALENANKEVREAHESTCVHACVCAYARVCEKLEP